MMAPTPKCFISFGCWGTESAVRYVRLFYRHNGGPWTQYPDTITTFSTASNQILLDTTLTGGDGLYEVYTLATDYFGNAEASKSTPEGSVIVTTHKVPRLYVNKAATGRWVNAAPTSRPPLLPPMIPSRSGRVYPSLTRYSPAAMKSSNTFCFLSSIPARCHDSPNSLPPRRLACRLGVSTC